MPNEEKKISSCCEGCHCGCIEYPNLHPCETLVNLFREKPYQGANPSKATMLFVGLDANYDERFKEGNPFLRCIESYHKDGVQFWKKHGVHHPFLLKEYPLLRNTGGVPYHRNFSKIYRTANCFDQEIHPSKISFVEIFHLPTTTEKNTDKLEPKHLCKKHMENLYRWIMCEPNKYIFLSGDLINLMKKMGKQVKEMKLISDKLNSHSLNYYDNENKILKILYEDKGRNIKIYKHFHFSSAETPQKKLETKAIEKLMNE